MNVNVIGHYYPLIIYNMKEHFEKAIQYVKANKSWYDDDESVALRRIGEYRCDLDFAAPDIAQTIVDLMEEYGMDNDLPMGWWMEFGTTEDIFYKLNE